jgi:hypothetical protein
MAARSPTHAPRVAYVRLTDQRLPWDSRCKDGPMASLSRRIMKFVQSPQGQQLVERAKVEVRKPENRRKLEQLRARYLNKRR